MARGLYWGERQWRTVIVELGGGMAGRWQEGETGERVGAAVRLVWEGVLRARFPQQRCSAAVHAVTRQRGSKSKAALLMNIKQRVLLRSTLPPPFLITEPQRRQSAPPLPLNPQPSSTQHKIKGEQKQWTGDREHTWSKQRLLYNSNKHLSSWDICRERWPLCGMMWEKME